MKWNLKLVGLLLSATLLMSCGNTLPTAPSNETAKTQLVQNENFGEVNPGPLPSGILLSGAYPIGSYIGSYSAGSGAQTVKLDVTMNWQSTGFGLIPWDFPAAFVTVCGYDQFGTNLFCKVSATVFGYSGGGVNSVTCTAPANLASVVVYGTDAISHSNDRRIYGRVGYFFADRGLQPGPFAPPC